MLTGPGRPLSSLESLAHISGIDQQLAAMYQYLLTRHARCSLWPAVLSLLALLSLPSIPSARAESNDKKEHGGTQVKKEKKERAAMTACLSGDVAAGIALLAELYVSYLKPIYLFNQGRCYQQNGRYADAIARFREYQRKIRSIGEAPDGDADGHIKECEALLNGERPAAPPGTATASPLSAPNTKSLPQSSIGGEPSDPGTPTIVQPPPSPTPAGARIHIPTGPNLPDTPAEPSPPMYKRTWFWVVGSTVIVTAVFGGLWALGAFKGDACTAGYDCK